VYLISDGHRFHHFAKTCQKQCSLPLMDGNINVVCVFLNRIVLS